jgi:hypothetical protein
MAEQNDRQLPPRPDVQFFEMMARLTEKSYWQRLRLMFRGLGQPRDSGEYRQARTELQRQMAPLAALLLPLACILLLGLLVRARPVEESVTVIAVEQAPPPDTALIDIDTPEPLPPTFEPPPAGGSTPLDPVPPPRGPPEPRGPEAPPPPPGPPGGIRKTIPMIPGFLPRQPGEREKILEKYPESARQTEDAVMRALRWLKLQQQADGSWPRNKPAMTALAVLAFLAHNETPASPEFGETVRRGIEYLLASQPAGGQWRGNYEHYIVTYALCEAYGMTHNPGVRAAAERAVKLILDGQHPSGGWDYGLAPGDRDDTSVMGWAAQALKAAMMADFYSEPEALLRACKLAVKGFQKNAHPEGGFGYTSPARGGLSSVGTLCMQFHGAGGYAEVRRTLELLGTWRPVWVGNRPGDAAPPATTGVPGVPPGGSPQYYYYYGTQALFQEGGKAWERWNTVMWPEYVKAQFVKTKAIADVEGELQDIGWWENADQHSDRPVMDTCLAALQLMVYYRYLPTFKASVIATHDTPPSPGTGDVPVSSDL